MSKRGDFTVKSTVTKAALFGRYFPEYRDGVFCRLAERTDIAFSFFSGETPRGSFIQQTQTKPYPCGSLRVFCFGVPGTRNHVTYRTGALAALLRRRYDVLILSNDVLGPDVWLCCLLSRIFRVSVCIWGQGLSRPPSAFRDALHWVQTSLATAALFYTDSGRDYWIQKRIPTRKLFVAYNALDTQKQVLVREQATADEVDAFQRREGLTGKRIVTFLGRLIVEKKPRVFIDVVARVAEQEPDVIGVLIGDGPERAHLEAHARERQVAERIRFVGALYDETVMARYLLSSVAVVLPAFAGLAIQHAAVYGAPLILGDLPNSHGPEQEIVRHGETGLWCPDEDVDAFATAIVRLIRDPTARGRLSTNLMRVIDDKYNVGNMAQGFVDAVRYCRCRRRPPPSLVRD